MGVASTTFMTMVGLSVNRDGVRIEAPHDLQEHDEHKIWTKKNTWHWETGWVWHFTQGQVLHVDANLVETHINMSPIQVHMNQGILPVNLKVHVEPNFMTRTHHFHAGRHGSHFNELEQEAGEIELHAVRRVSGVGTIPGLSAIAAGLKSMAGIKPTPGTLTLKADGEMTLESPTKLSLQQTLNRGSLSLERGQAKLSSDDLTDISSNTKVCLDGSGATATFEHKIVAFNNGSGSSIKCDGAKIQTDSTRTQLNGRVYLGNPAVAPPAGRRTQL